MEFLPFRPHLIRAVVVEGKGWLDAILEGEAEKDAPDRIGQIHPQCYSLVWEIKAIIFGTRRRRGSTLQRKIGRFDGKVGVRRCCFCLAIFFDRVFFFLLCSLSLTHPLSPSIGKTCMARGATCGAAAEGIYMYTYADTEQGLIGNGRLPPFYSEPISRRRHTSEWVSIPIPRRGTLAPLCLQTQSPNSKKRVHFWVFPPCTQLLLLSLPHVIYARRIVVRGNGDGRAAAWLLLFPPRGLYVWTFFFFSEKGN